MTGPEITDIATVKAAIALPTLTGRDGERYQATRVPRLADGLDFLQATRDKPDLPTLLAQIDGARKLLLGMGFPAEVVGDLGAREAVERALDFFLDDLGMRMVPPEASPTGEPPSTS